jgi:excisionase family DNA binding protein
MTATEDYVRAVGIARAAKALSVSAKTVRRRLSSGEWRGFRIGNRWRVSTAEIARIIAGQAGR